MAVTTPLLRVLDPGEPEYNGPQTTHHTHHPAGTNRLPFSELGLPARGLNEAVGLLPNAVQGPRAEAEERLRPAEFNFSVGIRFGDAFSARRQAAPLKKRNH